MTSILAAACDQVILLVYSNNSRNKGYICDKMTARHRAFVSLLFSFFEVLSPSQEGGGGGGACSLDPLIFLDFIPCSPLIKPLVPKNVFSSRSLDPEFFCAVPFIPKNVYHCSPYLFACFTFLFIVEKIAFEPPLSSPWDPLMLYFTDCRFCHLN